MSGDLDTLDVVAQADYETVLAALRDYIRLSEGRRETYGVDHTLRLAEIRELARDAKPEARCDRIFTVDGKPHKCEVRFLHNGPCGGYGAQP